MSSLFKYSVVLRIIKNIEKTALLSEHVNLLAAEVKPEAVDQKMQDFETQIDLAEEKQ
ncbi:uncharacterized protein BDCG_16961 [Blastomyces dermatitidis ER-3]|uniref:Uncharacterized protein n=1 Tax=Ajellomyces dermatitidis (strain ER-3 / ATCC MYA-2586) TaxID=559297 RepID=A0ABX2VVK4_AJEDR|nr:uncharacterized protein BDCG_16961 [Blastomyces dermatitidis ER-3]OAT01196.1 hypothetical protein BDCG_16961 [Blastomyces dermatitidis ER-3]